MFRTLLGYLIICLGFTCLGYAIENNNIYLFWISIFLPFVGILVGIDGESGAA